MIPKDKLSEFSEDFHKRIREKTYSSRMVDWVITWDVGIVEKNKLWPIFKKALPYEAMVNEKYHSKSGFDKLGKWIDKNCTGLWTHSTIIYRFELEEDAMAFKLRWS